MDKSNLQKFISIFTGNKSQKLLFISISIYLLMVSATFGLNLFLTLNPRASQPKEETIVQIAKEVDRSQGKFITQFNFALFLIGTSVWIFRRSVVEQLKIDVEKDIEKELKYLMNKIEEESKLVELLNERFEIEKEKKNIFLEISASIPAEGIFFQQYSNSKTLYALDNLSDKLESLIMKSGSKLILTVEDFIQWGNCLYHLARYHIGSDHHVDGDESGSVENKQHNSFSRSEKLPEEVKNYCEKAKKQYDKATKIQTSAYEAWFGLGNTYRTLKDYDYAIYCYEKVIKMKSSSRTALADAQVSKALALRAIGEKRKCRDKGIKEGMSCIKEALNHNPRNVRALYNKACFHALLDQEEETLKELKKVKDIAPHRGKELAMGDPDFESIKDKVKKLFLDEPYTT